MEGRSRSLETVADGRCSGGLLACGGVFATDGSGLAGGVDMRLSFRLTTELMQLCRSAKEGVHTVMYMDDNR